MSERFPAVVLAVACLTLTACHPSDTYREPTIGPEGTASIVGSKIVDPDPLAADARIYMVAIDGRLTGGGPFAWDEKIKVLPGQHEITFGIASKSAFKDEGGFITSRAVLEAGKAYVLQGTKPISRNAVCAETSGWISTDDGKAVTDKNPLIIREAGGAEIPILGGGFVSLPSNVHCS